MSDVSHEAWLRGNDGINPRQQVTKPGFFIKNLLSGTSISDYHSGQISTKVVSIKLL